MITYKDPEKDYQFKKLSHGSIKTKIYLGAFFVLVIILMAYLLKSHFRPGKFLAKEEFVEKCSEVSDLKIYQDISLGKVQANQVVKDNLAELSKLPGFQEVLVIEEKTGFQGDLIPTLQIILNKKEVEKMGLSRSKVEVPDEICSFPVKLLWVN